MSSIRPISALILVLLHVQLVKVQGPDHASQKLRRLNEQFQQFQALTQARLDMLALNQNRNSSWSLARHVQTLNDHYHHMSQDLEHLTQSTTQEIEGLREWSRKLEKKNRRLENRLSSVERNLRENQCHVRTQNPDPNQDVLNLTLEIQSQEERLAALQLQRHELLVGLNGLQESLNKQGLRVNQLEGRLGEVLQWNEGGKLRAPGREVEPSSTVMPQEYYEPRRRRPGRVLGGRTHHGSEGNSHRKTYGDSQAKPHQQHSTNQPKHLHVQKPRPRSHPQVQEEYPSAPNAPQPAPHQPQSQVQVQAQTRPYPNHQEQHQTPKAVPFPLGQFLLQRHPQSHKPSRSTHLKAPTHPKPNGGKQSKGEAPQPQASGFHPQPQSESYESWAGRWTEEVGEQSNTMIHNLLQLPARHKIPEQSAPKKNATICNVDSMLFFPSSSVENYVTFSSTLPDLSEMSVCLWLRVEDSHVGTLLSYATDDNDNQLVLYGRNSSAPSIPLLSSPSSSSHPSSSFSYISASSPSLDFVIGDPVYRRLPTSSLLDSRWHHLCVLWSSIQGRYWHYTDRRLTSSGSNFRKGWEIPGGGAVVLGQDQDTVGGGYHPAEGFVGQVAGFRVWNRVLSPYEVKGVADGKGVPRGVVLDMEDVKEVRGQVQQVACECLEYCV